MWSRCPTETSMSPNFVSSVALAPPPWILDMDRTSFVRFQCRASVLPHRARRLPVSAVTAAIVSTATKQRTGRREQRSRPDWTGTVLSGIHEQDSLRAFLDRNGVPVGLPVRSPVPTLHNATRLPRAEHQPVRAEHEQVVD